MTGPVFIPGFDSNYLVPKFAARMVFGAGVISSGAQPFVCLCIGKKLSTGSMTPDVDVVQCFGMDDADAKAGAGSQLALMAQQAVQIPGAQVWMAACAEPPGAKATVTIVLGGAVTKSGEWSLTVGGVEMHGGITNGLDTNDTVGAAIAAACVSTPRLPFSGAYNAGTHTLTLTCNHFGLDGNDWIAYFDPSNFTTTGLTATVTGSAQVDSNAYRVFAGVVAGSGVDSYTNILGKLAGMRFARIASGATDGTNAAALLSEANNKSAATVLLFEQVLFAWNQDYSTAQTLAKTTLNSVLCQVLWYRNCEVHPALIAATFASARSAFENDNPLYPWDGFVLPNIPGQRFLVDYPSDTEQNTALQNGVTPVTTSGDNAVVVRAITSHCVSGSAVDRRTIDVGDVTVPQKFVTDLGLFWTNTWVKQNPLVGDNFPPDGDFVEPGVGTPSMWDAATLNIARDTKTYGIWLQPVADTDISSYFSDVGGDELILQECNITPRRLQHKLGTVVNQMTPG
jgi:phage tail sheath gpL-like